MVTKEFLASFTKNLINNGNCSKWMHVLGTTSKDRVEQCCRKHWQLNEASKTRPEQHC